MPLSTQNDIDHTRNVCWSVTWDLAVWAARSNVTCLHTSHSFLKAALYCSTSGAHSGIKCVVVCDSDQHTDQHRITDQHTDD